MTDRVFNVLFLCTGNSARSILAESLLNQLGEGRFRAFSAGSQPKGEVHPLALGLLRELGHPVDGLRSKSVDEFGGADAPVMDFVFTVCDNAAGEVCPIWPGHPMTAHWGIEDPAAATGTSEQREQAFHTAFRLLANRIRAFIALPLAGLERESLRAQLQQIGHAEGASAAAAPVDVVIYHNPDCGTSRNTLALIRHCGFEPHVIEYLKTPPSRALLAQLAARTGEPLRALIREKGTPYAELGLGNPALSDDELLDAMVAHPILINRPLVVSPLGVALCRPSERVLDLLPMRPRGAFVKEDGEAVLDAQGRRVG
ncbi:MAG: arsenate reductase (glutaredoxin) [Lysobacterales bacterium 14-68-21]|jgi:arsenate reductase (glutaredoxin)|nr:MAG: arsenate reductase (glutaredoxin) [Xanthomonadales bacterium 15-68-25]OZB67198.1 MAG: arsenate reductase (glutaredoxin) [Xanthomonadales bacterium 14-68-21]